jgi:hypothetical protein
LLGKGANVELTLIKVAEIYGYTSGFHSDDGTDDIPAEDPWEFIDTLDFLITNPLVLTGKRLYLRNNCWGSYHESCIDVDVFISEEDARGSVFKEGRKEEETHSIRYLDTFLAGKLESLLQQIKDACEFDNDPLYGEQRDEYWKRLIEKEKMTDVRNLDKDGD